MRTVATSYSTPLENSFVRKREPSVLDAFLGVSIEDKNRVIPEGLNLSNTLSLFISQI